MAFRLPRLNFQNAIANSDGTPTRGFFQLFNVDLVGGLEAAVAAQAATIEGLRAIVEAIQAASEVAQAAQQTANQNAGGNTASSTGLITADGSWQPAVLVTLTGVVAGDLTISGTGPIQTSVVRKLSPGVANGEFRVVEVVGGIDDILISGTYSVSSSGEPDVAPLVNSLSSGAIAAFVSARTSSGTIDYRVDVRQTSGTVVDDLSIYLFARRT